MGFQEGNLLEPSCGIGNFIGMLPKSMEKAKVYGVELDTIVQTLPIRFIFLYSFSNTGLADPHWP